MREGRIVVLVKYFQMNINHSIVFQMKLEMKQLKNTFFVNVIFILIFVVQKQSKQQCSHFYKIKKSMETSALITIASSYSIAAYVFLPLATVYLGIFLSISNNYVFRPKIQLFLQKAAITSNLACDLIVDVLSNLSFLSYAICSFFMTATTDQPLRTLEMYNCYWPTICLAIVIYLKHNEDQPISNFIISKNMFILICCYVAILYHYFTSSFLVSLPAILLGVYMINLLLNSNEEKFIEVMLEILSIKTAPPQRHKTKFVNKMPTLDYLAINFPVSREQMENKIQENRKKQQNFNPFKINANKKQQTIQIDTKILAKQKLMQICTCLHLSLIKKQEEQMNSVRQYFGYMNGTISQKTNEPIKNKKGQQKQVKIQHEGFYNKNRGKTTQRSTKKAKKTIKQIKPNGGQDFIKQTQHAEITVGQLISSERNSFDEQPIQYQVSDNEDSLLFYIFPVKIFQFSRVASGVVSLMINIGFGIMLSYCQSVLSTLTYGLYFDIIAAAMFLPIPPVASPREYFNTMSLASIMKYGICGLLLLFNIATNTSGSLYLTWTSTNYVQYLTLVQVLVLCFSFAVIISGKRQYKTLALVFLLSLAGNCGILYLITLSNN